MTSSRLLFVRHGKSTANEQRIIGTADASLTEEGEAQAKRTGRTLHENYTVTRIVCSPYLRARQTAAIIADEVGLPPCEIVVVDSLRERHLGDLEGTPKLHPFNYFFMPNPEHHFEPPDELAERMRAALGEVETLAGQTAGFTVVVGHAISGFYLCQVAEGKHSFNDFSPVRQAGNAEVVEIYPSAEN